MAHFWQALRSGAWLTPDRARGYSMLLLGFALAGLLVWVALSEHLLDRNGKPLGTDFSSFYAAGSLVLDGRATDVYDMALHHAREQLIFGAATPYYAWMYPPLFLLVAAPLALLPYPLALAVWQGSTLVLYLLVIAMIGRPLRRAGIAIGPTWLFAAAAFPAVFINLTHGQNGLLSAALFGGALVALPQRPMIAGLLFGLLAYKPQFALVIPVALIAGSNWRATVAATLTVAATVVATLIAFGLDLWPAFFASMEASRKLLLEQGNVGFEKLQSAFAAVRLLGGGIPIAYAVQGVITAAVICATAWVWHARLDHPQKSAVLLVGTLLASPHVLDYDLTILGPALAFATMTGLMRGFRAYEITLLAATWFVPLIARTMAGIAALPLGFIVLAALYAALLRRTTTDVGDAAVSNHRLAPV